jgi:hypothetical protein
MDLLKRLRKVEPDGEGERTRWYRNPDGPEAADEIERLREDKNLYAETIYELEKDIRVKDHEVERLREALKRIAENNDGLDVWSFAEAALKGDE